VRGRPAWRALAWVGAKMEAWGWLFRTVGVEAPAARGLHDLADRIQAESSREAEMHDRMRRRIGGRLANRRVWIVGRVLPGEESPPAWEFLGVFTDCDAAVARCTTPNDALGPAKLDEPLPDEMITWPGFWFPMTEPAPRQDPPQCRVHGLIRCPICWPQPHPLAKYDEPSGAPQ